jgi:hypothetical protein
MLAESPGGPPKGWGLFIHDPRATGRGRALTVEVPHPIADTDSELVGQELFERGGAANLFIAGAHRHANADDSADVAHNAASPFAAVSNTVGGPGQVVIQVHGFDEDRRGQDYGEIVLSNGTPDPSSLERDLAGRLDAAGFRACLFEGSACGGLAGATNVEGQAVRAAGGEFLHLELARDLRTGDSPRARLVASLASAIGSERR